MTLYTMLATTLTATAIAAAALGSAGAATATSSGPSSAADIVRTLETKGNEVILTTVSGGDPSRCTITSVRPGHTTTMGKSFEKHGAFVPTQTHTPVYVQQRC
ncbi:hypothetical protein H7J06_02665 [Mycobacterium hodleri]|uniref:hypothetical protein n=1 Tax=Mycolicibacterium hodleri TaxID=49897 RepID=UPI0021F2D945|nr:hypothetical protein [Mycolicibacterium hodleri]MCV7131877.1 hypothetical protein [Mycolicibacterium hodleri]